MVNPGSILLRPILYGFNNYSAAADYGELLHGNYSTALYVKRARGTKLLLRGCMYLYMCMYSCTYRCTSLFLSLSRLA